MSGLATSSYNIGLKTMDSASVLLLSDNTALVFIKNLQSATYFKLRSVLKQEKQHFLKVQLSSGIFK